MLEEPCAECGFAPESLAGADVPDLSATAAHAHPGRGESEWTRRGRRSKGSVFTVDSLGRCFVHDVVHHLHDVAG